MHEGGRVLAKQRDIRNALDVFDYGGCIHGKLLNIFKSALGGIDIDHWHGGNPVDYDDRHSYTMIVVIVNSWYQIKVAMTSDVKQRMIEKAMVLLARKGLQRASFTEVLEASGAPRGSLYHHFPGGKNELVMAAMNEASRRAMIALEALNGQPADKVAAAFASIWATVLTRSHLQAGCAVIAVTLASDSRPLRERAGEIFKSWRDMVSRMLVEGGVPHERSQGLAASLIAACEGAVAIARAENSMEPFNLVVTEQLTAVKEAMDPA